MEETQSYPGCPPLNCWHKSEINIRNVFNTRSCSEDNCFSRGSDDVAAAESDPLAVVDSTMITQELLIRTLDKLLGNAQAHLIE